MAAEETTVTLIVRPGIDLQRSEGLKTMLKTVCGSVSGMIFTAVMDGNGKADIRISYLKMADRKSTRLNSSHLVISYAVFCLKKKKSYLSELHRVSGYR